MWTGLPMLFNSLAFGVFALIFFAGWPLAKRRPVIRWAYITLFSLVFYGWWDWRFLFLLLFSGGLDYAAALGMAAYPRYRKGLLGISLAGNLGALAIFKYSGWAADTLEQVLGWSGLSVELSSRIPAFMLILPAGISFYTFQSLSYTLDVYHGRLKPVRNIWHFFAFLSLFPQLVAGPILRAQDILDQLRAQPSTREADRWAGLVRIVQGLFKKMVIADNLAPFVQAGFGTAAVPDSALYAWVLAIAFGFQIYYDFGGYSDIALGLLRWMGYQVPDNFRQPYLASSLRDFWARWHISLSTWFRDYVYIPLGGNQHHLYRNLWITMVLSGIWHGAAWHFVVWGGWHALCLSVERWLRLPVRMGRWGFLLTLPVVWIGWVLFRAPTLSDAGRMLLRIFTPGSGWPGLDMNITIYLLLAAGLELWYAVPGVVHKLQGPRWQYAGPWLVALVFALTMFFRGPGAEFIYFQF